MFERRSARGDAPKQKATDRPEGRKIMLQYASLRCVLRGGYSPDSQRLGVPADTVGESQQHTREY